jgi:hypothetical protein
MHHFYTKVMDKLKCESSDKLFSSHLCLFFPVFLYEQWPHAKHCFWLSTVRYVKLGREGLRKSLNIDLFYKNKIAI